MFHENGRDRNHLYSMIRENKSRVGIHWRNKKRVLTRSIEHQDSMAGKWEASGLGRFSCAV